MFPRGLQHCARGRWRGATLPSVRRSLEWIFSEACEFAFHLSADNLAQGIESSGRFESEVEVEKKRLIATGLPERAVVYEKALVRLIEARMDPDPPLPGDGPV